MSPKRLGSALFDLGSYACGGTLFFLLICGGMRLWSNDVANNPFLVVVAWGSVVMLGGGLLLTGAGYVLREASDEPAPPSPDLETRVKHLEAEVVRLRALLALPVDPSDPLPPGSPSSADARITEARYGDK